MWTSAPWEVTTATRSVSTRRAASSASVTLATASPATHKPVSEVRVHTSLFTGQPICQEFEGIPSVTLYALYGLKLKYTVLEIRVHTR